MFLMISTALASQGACLITWSTTTDGLRDPFGNYAYGEGYNTMYLFSIDADAYTDITKGGENNVSSAVWSKYGSRLNKATDWYLDDGMGQILMTDFKVYGVGDTAYGAIILTYDVGEGITHYIANAAAYTFKSDADVEIAEMDTFIGGESGTMSTVTGWTAVPEPSSGIMMLIGMAGLALRRRKNFADESVRYKSIRGTVKSLCA